MSDKTRVNIKGGYYDTETVTKLLVRVYNQVLRYSKAGTGQEFRALGANISLP